MFRHTIEDDSELGFGKIPKMGYMVEKSERRSNRAVLVRVVKGKEAQTDIRAGITFKVAGVGRKHSRNEKTTLEMGIKHGMRLVESIREEQDSVEWRRVCSWREEEVWSRSKASNPGTTMEK